MNAVYVFLSVLTYTNLYQQIDRFILRDSPWQCCALDWSEKRKKKQINLRPSYFISPNELNWLMISQLNIFDLWVRQIAEVLSEEAWLEIQLVVRHAKRARKKLHWSRIKATVMIAKPQYCQKLPAVVCVCTKLWCLDRGSWESQVMTLKIQFSKHARKFMLISL